MTIEIDIKERRFHFNNDYFGFDEDSFWIEAYPDVNHRTEKKSYLQRTTVEP